MSQTKLIEDPCDICGYDTDNGYFSWKGQPFSSRKTLNLCLYCGNAIKPIVKDNIAYIGTDSGEIYTLKEMVEDGFDKQRATISIKKVAQSLGFDSAEIKKLIK